MGREAAGLRSTKVELPMTHYAEAESGSDRAPAQGPAPARVLFIAGTQLPRYGGPAFSAKNIWISAARAGIQATTAIPVATPLSAAEAQTIAQLRSEGIDLHTFPVLAGPGKFAFWGVSPALMAWVLRSARHYDIVQVHGAWMVPSLVGLIAARRQGAAFILVPHESMTKGDVLKGKNGLRHGLKRLMKAAYLRYADTILFASDIERRESMEPAAAARAEVLYHPVFDDLSSLPPPRHWPESLDRLQVGFLGRFDPKKQIELLIEAAAGTPNVSLHMAGAGPEPYCRQLEKLAAERGLGGRIHWHGFISAEERGPFFASIDVLVMPSAFEGFGMVAAEAMCHGLPVIVSEATGMAEVIGRYGCGIVIPAAIGPLRAALDHLTKNASELSQFSERSLAAVRAELAFSSYGEKLATIYRALAAQSRSAMAEGQRNHAP